MGAARFAEPIFSPDNIRTGWEITKYILTGCFERLPDNKLVKLGRLLRLYDWFYLVVFLTFTLLFFYSLAR